ncbi:MAG: cobalt transporter, partial [Arachnia propionica]
MTAEALEPGRKASLQRRIRIVVALTITWNVIEAFVALTAGGEASSAALIGFGLDSVVEVLSAVAVAWQFASPDPERREKTALRVIAISFFALAAYVTTEAVLSLTGVRE